MGGSAGVTELGEGLHEDVERIFGLTAVLGVWAVVGAGITLLQGGEHGLQYCVDAIDTIGLFPGAEDVDVRSNSWVPLWIVMVRKDRLLSWRWKWTSRVAKPCRWCTAIVEHASESGENRCEGVLRILSLLGCGAKGSLLDMYAWQGIEGKVLDVALVGIW